MTVVDFFSDTAAAERKKLDRGLITAACPASWPDFAPTRARVGSDTGRTGHEMNAEKCRKLFTLQFRRFRLRNVCHRGRAV